MEGSATAVVLGQVVGPPEQVGEGYRLRLCVIERHYDRRTRTKTERSSWLWLDGLGPPPVLKKGEVVCVEAKIRSVHEERDEMRLEVTRIVALEQPERRSSKRALP